MGGGHSRQSYTDTTNIMNTALVTTAQNCSTGTVASQTLIMAGHNNIGRGLNQEIDAKSDVTCLSKAKSMSSFADTLGTAIAQSLSDKGVAGTQWLDNRNVDTAANVVNNITTSVTASDVADCTAQVVTSNTQEILGHDNLMENTDQRISADRVVNCLMETSSTNEAVNKITDTANQQTTSTSSNPLSFITDAASAAFDGLLKTAATIIIIVICLVAIYFVLRRVTTSESDAAPVPAAPVPAAPAA